MRTTELCYRFAVTHLAPDHDLVSATPKLSGHREVCDSFASTREELALLARHWCRIILEDTHSPHATLASESSGEYAHQRVAELRDVLGAEVVDVIKTEVAAEFAYDLDE